MHLVPTEICLDANIFIAALVKVEPLHQAALELWDKIDEESIDLFEPGLVFFEVISALHQKSQKEGMSHLERDTAIDIFYHTNLIFQWQASVLKTATDLASRLDLKRIYDCSYLAVAMNRKIPFITSDERFLRAGKKIYREIYSCREFLENVSI
ncbi:MAG: type II toxin-antitoxin system VapC family toxin [Deltaproteobacteria bacterium]|nr:MAG: type II toxin-antitoxin system VapC family toxin [Deltaproteobacteria bacterium]